MRSQAWASHLNSMAYTTQTSKLKRARNQRRALLRILAAQLVTHKKLHTTEVRAKAMRPFVERLVTAAKRGTLASERQVARVLPKSATHALVHAIAPAYAERAGGYVRITKVAPRKSDGARMAFIEFV